MSFIPIEDCGKGENCPVHYRVSEHDIEGLISLIDYVGGYAIHTLESTIADGLWAIASGDEVYDYRVKVFHVGASGTLAKLADNVLNLKINTIRDEGYYLPDDICTDEEIADQMMAAHLITVDLVKSGVITSG